MESVKVFNLLNDWTKFVYISVKEEENSTILKSLFSQSNLNPLSKYLKTSGSGLARKPSSMALAVFSLRL